MAAVASLCASAAIVPAAIAAPGDLPDLVQSIPSAPAVTPDADTGLVNWGGFFDDHSIGGDDHMGWSHSGSDPEALKVSFQSVLSNTGNGALELCGYPAQGSAAWLRAFQTTPGDLAACPGNAPSGSAAGWFRYAIANHSGTGAFNRWHLMDLQRFALVPVNAPAGTRTQWDTRWGTCMNDNGFMDCENNAGATNLQVGIAPHANKVTEEGAPDQTVVAFPNRVPNGTYQLVAISNPYGAIREAGTTYGSVSCVTLQVSGNEELGEWRVYQSGSAPANCQLPTSIPGALSGPGGLDPFARAVAQIACNPLLTATGHCWDTIPVDGNHPLARTNVVDSSTATATRSVAQYGAVGTYGGGGNSGGGNNGGGGGGGIVTPPRTIVPPVPPPGVTPPKGALTLPALETRKARSYTRSALRATFGVLPSSAKVTCQSTGGANATCSVSWKRPHGKSYRGTVRVWFTSTTTRVSWNYDLSVQRKQHGRTSTTTRGARVGGTVLGG
jgi:hypothetical protein